MMQAVVKREPGWGAELVSTPIPKVGPGQILVRVLATSICGSDHHIYIWNDWAKGRIKPPLTLGHEFAGEVVEVGEGVTQVSQGDRVSAETHVVCGYCSQCRTGHAHTCYNTKILGVDMDGAFAEYVALPAENAWVNPPELPVEIASVQEPFGNAVHTVLSGPVAGSSLVVLGCGPIGLFAVGIARACGAARVYAVDTNDYRLELAEAMGADLCLRADQVDPVRSIWEDNAGQGVDVALEMSGAVVAVQQSIEVVKPGGRVSLLGIPAEPVALDLAEGVVMKGITLQGIAGRRMYETWYQTRALLSSGRVDIEPVITHRLPLSEFEKGMELMGSGQCGKVILTP